MISRFIFILTTSCIAVANSVSLNCNHLQTELPQLIEATIRDHYSSVSIASLNILEHKPVQTGDCTTAKITIPSVVALHERLTLKVDVYDEQDVFIRRQTMFYDIIGTAHIFVAKYKLTKGDQFQESVYDKKTIGMDQLIPSMVGVLPTDHAYVVTSYIGEGQPIESWMITKKADVMKGTDVMGTYDTNGVLLTLPAVLMENGNIGDVVKLKLKNNDKFVQGKVISHETISIISI